MAHNKQLAEKQGLDETTCSVIDNLQILSVMLNDKAKTTRNPTKVKDLFRTWFKNEQLLQTLWKFEANDNRIKFWTFSRCTCSPMDNAENYPQGPYFYNGDCVVHNLSLV